MIRRITNDEVDQLIREKYLPVGGVRIEDNVIITKDGIDNLVRLRSVLQDQKA